MKTCQRVILFVFVFTFLRSCFGIEDTNIIAAGAWSEPVSNDYGQKLRGRLLMCAYPDHRGGPAGRLDLGVYVELQEYSDSIGDALQVYCDFTKGLKCQVADALRKSPEPVGTGFNGGAPSPQWISLPLFSSIRLRANVYAGGRLNDGSLGLWFTGAGVWTIKPTDTNTYFLSGTFTANTSPANNFNHTQVWRGTLKLPKMKIPKM